MLPAQTFSVSIKRDWRALYEQIWRPEFFHRWASGLAQSGLRRCGDDWLADSPDGPVRLRFTDRNEHGVTDHAVELSNGQLVHVPLRVVPNGEGAEVLLTLFRQPGMSDDRYAADAEWMRRDLDALKALAER